MKTPIETTAAMPGSVKRLVGLPPRKAHGLKTWPQYLDAILSGAKTFDVRKNDRDFRQGDILHLREWFPEREEWGPRSVTCFVSYILHGPAFGVRKGYCVMALAMPANHSKPNDKAEP